jgi:hypothetical protein
MATGSPHTCKQGRACWPPPIEANKDRCPCHATPSDPDGYCGPLCKGTRGGQLCKERCGQPPASAWPAHRALHLDSPSPGPPAAVTPRLKARHGGEAVLCARGDLWGAGRGQANVMEQPYAAASAVKPCDAAAGLLWWVCQTHGDFKATHLLLLTHPRPPVQQCPLVLPQRPCESRAPQRFTLAQRVASCCTMAPACPLPKQLHGPSHVAMPAPACQASAVLQAQ